MSYYNETPNYGLNQEYQYYQDYSYSNDYSPQVPTSSQSQVAPIGNFSENPNGIAGGTAQDLNRNSGAIKKKPNYKNKSWNNGKRNERYGSGRTVSGKASRQEPSNYGRGENSLNYSRSDNTPNYSRSENAPNHSRSENTPNYSRSENAPNHSRSENTLNYSRSENRPGEPESSDSVRYHSYNNSVVELYDCPVEEPKGPGSSNANKIRYPKQNNGKNDYQSRDQTYRNRNYYYDDGRKNNYKGKNYKSDFYENRAYPKNSRSFNNEDRDYGVNNVGDGYPKERNNWRRFESNYGNKKYNSSDAKKKLDAASQRERLEEMLSRRTLECLVCCEKIRYSDRVWSCEQCYHILHLNCVVAWANSSKLENGWRCPACQNVCRKIPNQYTCYCGKSLEPRSVPGVVAHACGDACMKKGRTCDHKCTILCHPGPCPDCHVMVAKSCGCGSTKQTVKCSADTQIVCDAVCSKLLNCGLHCCQAACHTAQCEPCDKTIEQICFCEKVGRRVKCSAEFHGATSFVCDDVCGKLLSCGNHRCEKQCHPGECEPCARDVLVIKTCPCERSALEVQRKSCLDPIPCCEKICAKILNCGQPAAPHTCKLPCHEGPCPPCPLTTFVRCRCGHMDKEIPCDQLTSKADDARCEKKCTKKRLCGKHRCNQRCCIEFEHICPLPCNHLLACCQHRCELTCHSGRCLPCIETSFEELYCECGASVLYPPVPCGTRPPSCSKPCSRGRPCGHEVTHTCHTGACPPCTVLCKRWCHGKHEQRSAIPCYQEDFSCGLACGKALPCGRHKCEKPCHLGPCPLPCRQKCTVKRLACGHGCGVACHKPPCPETLCRFRVPLTCVCGLLKSTRPCNDLAEEYRELEMSSLKDKMADLLKDQTVDITDIVSKPKRPAVLKILDCNEDCKVMERNRRLAIGLQIRNPDVSQKLTPRYSDFMRGWAKKDAQFCQKIHEKLSELVQLAKQSKQKSRSHSFESMNRDKRHFIHEYCEHFGCESAAYDMEPHRNIVATAMKDKSWLPSMSLLQVIQRENGQRKVPGPVLGQGLVGKSETVALKLPGRGQKQSAPGEVVDYFDNPPV